MQHTDRLIADNVHTLIQGSDLISAIDDEAYSTAPDAKSTVGVHFRHCIDFYSCFAAGIDAGRINYDLRERNSAVETNRRAAIEKIESIIEALRGLSAEDAGREVQVITEDSSDGRALDWSRSSMKRELQFLLSHTIHHYAIVAASLRQRGIEPGEEFGVAPSTLRHWRAQSAR